jgi:hypothetical protein
MSTAKIAVTFVACWGVGVLLGGLTANAISGDYVVLGTMIGGGAGFAVAAVVVGE